MESTRVSQKAEVTVEIVVRSLYCGFCRMAKEMQGQQASLNNFSRPWNLGTDPNSLGQLGQADSGLVFKSPVKNVVRSAGTRMLGVHLLGTLKGELFTIARNWLTLGGTISPRSSRPLMLKHQNTLNKRHS